MIVMMNVVNNGNKHLCVRRLNLTDIERIAPLEEGCLPYHLVETQKQVGMFVAVCATCILNIEICCNMFYRRTMKAG